MIHTASPARLLALVLTLTLAVALMPGGSVAQDSTDAEVGAGQAPAEPVAPGLEERTPRPGLTADQVPLYLEQEHLVGRISLPDDRLAVLVQPEGRTWRSFRIQGVYWFATAVILATIVGLAAFYLWRGRIRIESGWSGRWVPRFGPIERFAHWLTAISFIVLAITGLVITFGRYLLIPLIGHWSFTPLAEVSKSLHNWSAIPFVVGIVMMLVLWIRDNIPERADWEWLRHGGGMFSRATPRSTPRPGGSTPARRSSSGQWCSGASR